MTAVDGTGLLSTGNQHPSVELGVACNFGERGIRWKGLRIQRAVGVTLQVRGVIVQGGRAHWTGLPT